MSQESERARRRARAATSNTHTSEDGSLCVVVLSSGLRMESDILEAFGVHVAPIVVGKAVELPKIVDMLSPHVVIVDGREPVGDPLTASSAIAVVCSRETTVLWASEQPWAQDVLGLLEPEDAERVPQLTEDAGMQALWDVLRSRLSPA